MDIFANVSWLGVIVGAVLAFLVGWAWYSPMLFGKQWAAGNNVDLGSVTSMDMTAMVTQGLGLLVIAWFVGLAEGSLGTIAIAAIGFALISFSGAVFARKGNTVAMIDGGYLIVAVAVMTIVQMVL